MAILAITAVPGGTQDDLGTVGELVEQWIMSHGGPPPGLMAHMAHPTDDGYILQEVWRQEAEMREFYAEVVNPALATAGLSPEATAVRPIWSFARP